MDEVQAQEDGSGKPAGFVPSPYVETSLSADLPLRQRLKMILVDHGFSLQDRRAQRTPRWMPDEFDIYDRTVERIKEETMRVCSMCRGLGIVRAEFGVKFCPKCDGGKG